MKDYSHIKKKVETEKEEEIKRIDSLKEKVYSDFDTQLPKMVQVFCEYVKFNIEYKAECFYKNGKKEAGIKKTGFLPFGHSYSCVFEMTSIDFRVHTEDICNQEMKDGVFISNSNQYFEMPTEKKLSVFIGEVNKVLSAEDIKVDARQILKEYKKGLDGDYYGYPTYRAVVSAKLKL